MVTLNTEEMDQMQAEVAAGKLPPDAVKTYLKNEEKAVFGHDVKHDRKGRPLEQGIGSPGRETGNHFNAIRRYEGEDAYWRAVGEIWKRDPERAEKLGLQKPPVPAKA